MMIEAVEIKNLRGIAEGKIEGLGRLAILVGPNGSGKSTVLDALLIGVDNQLGGAVGFVVRRRADLSYGARWLIHRGGRAGPRKASVVIHFAGDGEATTELEFVDGAPHRELRRRLVEREAPGAYRTIMCQRRQVDGSSTGAETMFAMDNTYASTDEEDDAPENIWLVDPRHGRRLDELFSRIGERGTRDALRDLLTPLIPDLELLELATDSGDARLNLGFKDRSVPVALAGDAVHALVRMALVLVTSPAEVLLFEEPEVHAHPAAMRQSARAIVEGVRNGKQVVLTTHSLELIDALLDALKGDEIDWLTLHGLRLDGGALKIGRMQGESVLRSRGEIGDELR